MAKKLNKTLTPNTSASVTSGKNNILFGNSSVIPKKGLDLSIAVAFDNIIVDKNGRATAYYKIPCRPFEFLSQVDKESRLRSESKAFKSVFSGMEESIEAMAISTTVPLDVQEWIDHNEEASKKLRRLDGYENYMKDESEYLKNEDFVKKQVYYAVVIHKEGDSFDERDIMEQSAERVQQAFKKALSKVVKNVYFDEVTQDTEKHLRNKEQNIYEIVGAHGQNSFGAERATTEEILLMLKRQFYPSMPCPYLNVSEQERYGPNDILIETTHALWNKMRYIEISQMIADQEMRGVRACLSLTKFPEKPYEIDFFRYIETHFPRVTTCYSRFVYHPAKNVEKEIGKLNKEAKAEVINWEQSIDNADRTLSNNSLDSRLDKKIEDIDIVKEVLETQGDDPWIEGSYRVIVEAPTFETLSSECNKIRQKVKSDLGIVVTWSVGDQLKLFLEQMPGDRRRVDSYDQTTTVSQLSTSGITLAEQVGDPIKPGANYVEK